jgi:hypothetical protein
MHAATITSPSTLTLSKIISNFYLTVSDLSQMGFGLNALLLCTFLIEYLYVLVEVT